MSAKIPMTIRGAELLKTELEKLKYTDRPRIIQAIAEARAHGDLKENAEYHAAREQQSFIEGRIGEIESKLANAQVVDIARIPRDHRVVFGTTIIIADTTTEEEITYQIVGEDEADLKNNRLSFTSPIARALIGKEEGDIVAVKTPAGTREYEIVEVQYL